jgi:hypothetical protein
LTGFHTVLSFFVVHLDEGCVAQKNLIDACIEAGVGRFAPSEWGIKNDNGIPSYDNKDTIRNYLEGLDHMGLLEGMEYSLFQPSIFIGYFAHPYPLERELITWPFFLDFQNRRAMVLDDGNQPIVLTAVLDDSEILRKAIEDERPWPKTGGIRGCRTSINELLDIGKKVRGGEWCVYASFLYISHILTSDRHIEYVKSEDLNNGELNTSWIPRISHPTIPEEVAKTFSREFVVQFFQAITKGSWDVSDEFNQRFPEYDFMTAEEYLAKAWEGKP